MDQPAVTPTGLRASISVDRAGFTLRVTLEADPGQVVAVLGPNGAGKTTLLSALAGLVPLSEGHVTLNGDVMEDTVGRVRVPTERRPIGVVFQDYLLFPRMSALENVAFGLRSRQVHRTVARARAHEWLERFGLGAFASRKPGSLSGGQAQRVALARALVTEPQLLLLDEPMAALDAATRIEVRSDLRRHLRAYPGITLLITHEPLEALALADHLVVLDGGSVVQAGPPQEVARQPRTDYVASLVGVNLVRGIADQATIAVNDTVHLAAVTRLQGAVFAVIRPSSVSVHRQRPADGARNVWPATVNHLEPHGDWVRVHFDGPLPLAADVTPVTVAELSLVSGDPVWLSCKATDIAVYPQ
jgi:molybdate transport system ATP-binding protein